MKLYTLYISLQQVQTILAESQRAVPHGRLLVLLSAANSVIRESRRPRYGHTVLMNGNNAAKRQRQSRKLGKAFGGVREPAADGAASITGIRNDVTQSPIYFATGPDEAV